MRGGAIEALLPIEPALAHFADYERVELRARPRAGIRQCAYPRRHGAHARDVRRPRARCDGSKTIWPAEGKHVSPRFVRDGTALACAEMLRGGITCFNDMYYFPEAALEAALEAGMRASLGLIVIEFPTAYASDPADYLRKGVALRDRYGEHPLVSFCFAPHAPYTVSEATFRQVATLAAELDLPVHVRARDRA